MLRTATASTPSPRSAAPPHTAGRTEDPQTAIAWAIGDSVLGPVAIAASLRGLCLLHFSADFDALRSRLGHAFRADYYPHSGGWIDYVVWDGTNDVGRALPAGTYQLRLKALRPLGDKHNPDHWDVWTSGPITLQR